MTEFLQVDPGFFVLKSYLDRLKSIGLVSFDSVFSFASGQDLSKSNLPPSRSRVEIVLPGSNQVLYLKRYVNTPIFKQVRNWLDHGKIAATMYYDFNAAAELASCGINTPQTIAYGQKLAGPFEKQSFIISARVGGLSLEKHLPCCFENRAGNLAQCRNFITALAAFARKFHETGYCHRDFYFCHIFYDNSLFYLIDLQRAFKPALFKQRFRIKDIAQLCYSAPSADFSRADRLRFILAYFQKDRLGPVEKKIIKAILLRTKKMARHDMNHGRPVVFNI